MLEENFPIEVFANELQRRSAENQRNAQRNSHPLSQREVIDIDILTAESLAKELKIWIDFSAIFSLGIPAPSGVENDVYLAEEGHKVYKVNNLMTSKSVTRLLQRLLLHNSIFPQTAYKLYGFTGFGKGSVYPVLEQDYIINATYTTPIEIETYMAALGFTKINESSFTHGNVIVSDLFPRNVLKDIDGDIFVVDADFHVSDRFPLPTQNPESVEEA